VYLLDTNIVSELRKVKPHGAVVAWIEGVPDAELFLCAVTLAEIQIGIEMTREQDARKAQEIEAWLDQVADTVYEDAMIAACARVHKLTVATRNLSDFKRFNVPIFNPFDKVK
jgi:toxin FitB